MNPNQPGNTPISESSLNRAPSREAAEFVDLAKASSPAAEATVTKAKLRTWLKRGGLALGMISLIMLIGGSLFWLRGRGNGVVNPDSYPVSSVGLESGNSAVSIPSTTSQLAVNGDVAIAGNLSLSPQAITNLAATLTNKITLQSTYPGSPQAGNANITGVLGAGSFVGNGARLTNLNADALTTGTVNEARLPANVTRLGQSISLSSLQGNVISSLNGLVNNGGNLDLVAGANVAISASGTSITISSTGGSGSGISTINVGAGLTGGGTGSSVNIDIDGAIVTTQGNSFNAAGQLVQLNGSGALPAVDGSLLTNLSGSAIATGTVSDARLSANVTLQGNTFNSASQLVQLTGLGYLPVLNASNLTDLNASSLATGTVPDARLSTNITQQGNIFNGAAQLVQLTGLGYLPVLNASNLTNLNASALATGTVPDARLSTNVPLKDGQNVFRPSSNSTSVLRVQNTSGTVDALRIDTTNTRVGIGFGVAVVPNYTLDVNGDINIAAGSAYRIGGVAICTSGGCAPAAGSTDYIQNSASLQSSANFAIISANTSYVTADIRGAVGQTADLLRLEDSSANPLFTVGASGLTTIYNRLNVLNGSSNAALTAIDSTGLNYTLRADAANNRLGIGYGIGVLPGYTLDVNGDMNLASGSAYRIGGTAICTSSGCLTVGGSGSYIQNGTTTQVANYAVQSGGINSVAGKLIGAVGQTADIFRVENSGNTPLLAVSATGNLTVSPSTNSTTAFQIKRADGTVVFNTDTLNSRTTIGAGGYTSSSALTITPTGSQVGLDINALNSGNLLNLTSSGVQVLSVTATGSTLFKSQTNSTTAFRIQDATSNTILNADTTNNRVNIGGGSLAASLGVTTSGTTVGALINNTGANFSILVQKSSTPVFGVASQGAVAIQTSTNLSQAVGVVNSGGGNVLQVGTGNSATDTTPSMTFNGSLIGDLSSWTETSPSGAQARSGGGAVALNGYLYHIGGQTSAPADSTTVQYATLNGDGTTGTFAATTVLPGSGSQYAGAAVYNGRIYVAQYNTTSIYYARPNNDGTITSWSTASATIGNSDIHPTGNTVIANGYLYIASGGGSNHNQIYAAKINPDGSLGSFVTAATYPGSASRFFSQMVYADGYLVVMGGSTTIASTTAQSSVYTFAVNSDGTLGTGATATNGLPAARVSGTAFVMNGYIYYVGGFDSSGNLTTTVYYSRISASGDFTSSWTTAGTSLGSTLYVTPATVYNGYAYFVFGRKAGIYSSSVATMTGPRVKLGGSLDLISIANGNLTSGSGEIGGSVYAGNISAAGRLQVSGNAQLAGGAVARNLFQVQGDAAFKASSASSTATLQVQDSSGNIIFNVDASNKAVSVGTATQTAALTVVSNTASLNLLQITDSTATAQNVLTIADGGATTFRNQTNSANSLIVQNAAGTNLFNVDASSSRITLGTTTVGVDIKFAGTGQVRNAISRDFTCTSTETVNDIVVFSASNTVARTTTANSNRVAGVVIAKPGTTTCTTAIAGVVPVWFSSNGAPATIGDPVVTSTVSGAAQSTTTPTTGAMLGNSLSTKDGSNLVWIRLR